MSATKASTPKRAAPSTTDDAVEKKKDFKKSKKDSAPSSSTYEDKPKPYQDMVEESLKIWNDLRKKNNTNDVNRTLADSLFKLLETKFLQVAKKHDASRVVQAMIQFGTQSQRDTVLSELKGSLVDLSKQQYSHFIVLKLFKYCGNTPASRRVLQTSLRSNMVSLATHAVAARVVEYALSELPSRDAKLLMREFCGKQYSLFGDNEAPKKVNNNKPVPTTVMDDVIEENLEQKESIVAHVLSVVEKMIEKKLFPFEFFHELLASYCSVASGAAVRTLASSVVDNSLHLLSTRAGTRALSTVASYSTAKDRKRIAKCFKGYTRSTMMHRDAYVAVIRVCMVTDDTVSTQKMVLNELLKAESETATDHPLFSIMESTNASKLLLLLLSKTGTPVSSHFDPWELALLGEATIKDDESGEMVSTSKKNPATRMGELRQYLKGDLIKCIQKHWAALVSSKVGGKVLIAAYEQWGDDVAAVVVDGIAESKSLSLFEDVNAQRCLKKMAQCESGVFGEKVCETLDVAKICETSRGAFFVLSLLEKEVEGMKKIEKKLEAACKKGIQGDGHKAGFEKVMEHLKK